MDVLSKARAARERIASHIVRTPLERSPFLERAGACRVHLKLENRQRTGSFKLRGAMARLTELSAAERERGVVAASTGNHGAAVAHGAAELGIPAVVFAPRSASAAKLETVRALGAEVRLAGEDCVKAELAARAHAVERAGVYVSPYNDPAVIAGQGTLGLELADELERIDAVFLSVGGGGLAAGVGGALRALRPEIEVIGCSPANDAAMAASVAAGRIVSPVARPTLSDATAGGLEPEAITFALCRELVREFVLVDEQAIAEAMRVVEEHHGMRVEGAAGVAVAAFLSHVERRGERWRGKDVVIVVCGGNVAAEAS